MRYFFIILCSYFIGSISFSVIIAKMYGVDILKTGSGNAGATNVRRSVGKYASKLVFFLDFLKGAAPVILSLIIFDTDTDFAIKAYCLATFSVICGHNFSIFLKFKGGKGVAVTMGALIVTMPQVAIFGAIFWYVIFSATRIVSLGSLCFALSLPLTSYLISYSKVEIILCFSLMAFIFIMHHKNIKRLLNGSESKFEK